MRTIKPILFSIIFIFFTQNICAAQTQKSGFKARVIKVMDGDSFWVKKDGRKIEVRLSSIDAPEYNQPYGSFCKDNLRDKILGQIIDIKPVEQDQYGRIVGFVMLDNHNINRELVSEGCAWAYRRYLRDNALIGIERNARAKKIGLWSQPKEDINPPWKFRKSERNHFK